jgi:hypothetical protein
MGGLPWRLADRVRHAATRPRKPCPATRAQARNPPRWFSTRSAGKAHRRPSLAAPLPALHRPAGRLRRIEGLRVDRRQVPLLQHHDLADRGAVAFILIRPMLVSMAAMAASSAPSNADRRPLTAPSLTWCPSRRAPAHRHADRLGSLRLPCLRIKIGIGR